MLALDGVVDLLGLAGAVTTWLDQVSTSSGLPSFIFCAPVVGSRTQVPPQVRPDAARDARADVQVAGLDLQPLGIRRRPVTLTGHRQLVVALVEVLIRTMEGVLRARPGVKEPVVVSEAARRFRLPERCPAVHWPRPGWRRGSYRRMWRRDCSAAT